jgi:hypothetical protein
MMVMTAAERETHAQAVLYRVETTATRLVKVPNPKEVAAE